MPALLLTLAQAQLYGKASCHWQLPSVKQLTRTALFAQLADPTPAPCCSRDITEAGTGTLLSTCLYLCATKADGQQTCASGLGLLMPAAYVLRCYAPGTGQLVQAVSPLLPLVRLSAATGCSIWEGSTAPPGST